MRHQLLKLSRGHSTKAERRFAELCKKYHIKFQTKVKIAGYEVDFLIKKTAVEIDSHSQNIEKNQEILKLGFNLVHLPSFIINRLYTAEWLRKL